MRYVLFYETNPAALPRARELFPRHRARIDEFHAAGTLLLLGTFENPLDGAMGVFTTREAAEAFAQGDPFVTEGVVAKRRLLGWNEILSSS